MTGKALVPIIHDGGDNWHATLLEVRAEMTTEEEVAAFEDRVIRRGYYPFRTDPVALQKLHGGRVPLARPLPGEDARDGREVDADGGRAPRRAPGVRVFCCPGNDDQFEVDEIIDRRSTSSSREGRVVDIDGFQMVSTGWANRTPWHTYREEDEPDLRKRLEAAISQVTAPAERDGLQLPLPAVPHGARRRARS